MHSDKVVLLYIVLCLDFANMRHFCGWVGGNYVTAKHKIQLALALAESKGLREQPGQRSKA